MKPQLQEKYYPKVPSPMELLDDQFSEKDLRNAINYTNVEARESLALAKEAVIKAIKENTKKEDARFVLDLDDNTKQQILDGTIKLVTKKNGETLAQLVDSNGKFGQNIPVTKEIISAGLTPETLLLAVQMQEVQQQLEEIMDTLVDIQQSVKEVLQGQHNDRIGYFYSGLNLYLEAKRLGNQQMKLAVFAQALKAISDANAQLIQEMRSSIEYLMTEKYKKTKEPQHFIKEHLDIINQCYAVILKAAILKMTIYVECGEANAAVMVAEEHGRLIEKLLVPYAGRLAELDKRELFIENGKWGQIASSLLAFDNAKEMLSQKNEFYLPLGE